MNFGDRVKYRRESLDMTQDELAAKLGYSGKWAISKIENGSADIPRYKVEEFAEALKTTPVFLMGYTDEVNGIEGLGFIDVQKHKIPLLGHIACGEPIFADEHIETYIDPKDVDADFALYAQGDSMIGDGINDGDVVYIRRQNDVNQGEIAVVMIDDEATLKHVYKHQGEVQLYASNVKYPPISVRESDGKYVAILGKAVGYYHALEDRENKN